MKVHHKRTTALIVAILVTFAVRAEQDGVLRRLTPSEIAELGRGGPGAGTSGVPGIQTTILAGDPTRPGLYTIMVTVPANKRIEPHSHRDNRSATVVSGTWYFGYGLHFDDKSLKPLPPGSFYTEPPGEPHFAQTRTEPVIVHITGYGPTDTTYVDKDADPRKP
jgi:quercetin dioxygenase-like cupin family protein